MLQIEHSKFFEHFQVVDSLYVQPFKVDRFQT